VLRSRLECTFSMTLQRGRVILGMEEFPPRFKQLCMDCVAAAQAADPKHMPSMNPTTALVNFYKEGAQFKWHRVRPRYLRRFAVSSHVRLLPHSVRSPPATTTYSPPPPTTTRFPPLPPPSLTPPPPSFHVPHPLPLAPPLLQAVARS